MMKKSSIAIHLLCILLLSLYSHAQQQPVDTTSLNSAASAFLDDWAQGHIVSAAARLSIDAVNSTCTQQLLSAGANPLSAEQEANAFKQYLNRAYLGNLKARPSNTPVTVSPAAVGTTADHEVAHDPAKAGDYALADLQTIPAGSLFTCQSDVAWLNGVVADQPLFGQLLYFSNGADSPTAYAIVWQQRAGVWKILAFGPMKMTE
jgi:hypothetical protein